MSCFIELMCGLGNQLFEIAAAYAHARRHGYQLQIKPTPDLKHDVYWQLFFPACNIYRTTSPCLHPKYTEPHYHYAQIPKEATNIHGYFQSSKYFNDYSDEIKALFKPSDILYEKMINKWRHLISEDYVVIHIRRGDYLWIPLFLGIIQPSYYVKAAQQIIEETGKTKFLVFSDDIEWCKHIGLPGSVTYIDESEDIIALLLMSQFKYYIISNSSFSWWAVWLGASAELVYAPDTWFGPEGVTDIEDVYEPGWVRLPIY